MQIYNAEAMGFLIGSLLAVFGCHVGVYRPYEQEGENTETTIALSTRLNVRFAFIYVMELLHQIALVQRVYQITPYR